MRVGPDLLLDVLGEFAERNQRVQAVARLARALGCRQFLLFAPDPELGVLLPAPGLSQTLPYAGEWRLFLERVRKDGQHQGELRVAPDELCPAVGVAAQGDVVAVAIGAGVDNEALLRLRPLFAMLGTAFRSERQCEAAEVKVSLAADSVTRSKDLTAALRVARDRLEDALAAAEAAGAEAARQTEQAQSYAEELEQQAAELEEQAAEMETLNEELILRNQEAEAARRLADAANAAKSEFLATMSHELRTPINAIMGYTEILEMGIPGPVTTEQEAHLVRIRASSRHLLTLINDVLDLAKIEAGEMTVARQRAQLRAAVADALGLLELQASERKIALDDACSAGDVTYVGDENRVRQILINLVSNAVKFTEPGGRVALRCGTLDAPAAELQLHGAGPWIWVDVEDNGIGITPADLTRIFQPFVQARSGHSRQHGGTGLGLTISRQLARIMGGNLVVRSEAGVGSCFTLWLPTENVPPGVADESIKVRTAGSTLST